MIREQVYSIITLMKLRTLIPTLGLIAISVMSAAQGRLILNGGKINIANGAVVVISNPAANAITRTSGHIISEGENNRIRWNIGTTAGTYTVPWGQGNTDYFPLTFTTSAASGAGFIYLATVATPAENSLTLPTGVTHFNGAAGVDMSLVAVDRFWKIDAQSYTTRPTLTNLIFTYLDAEFASPNKTAVENKLTANRWNSTSSTWTDYNTGSVVNTGANTITVASLSGTNLYPWWTAAYPGAAFHWIPTVTSNWNSAANWSATAAGAGGVGVPGPGDAVWFDGVRDGSSTINTTVDVASITMSSGYTGTVAQGNNAVSIATNADLQDGAFTGGAATLTVNGNLNLGGVAFTAPSTVLDIKRQMNIVAGTFAHNNGMVRFSGTNGTQQIGGTVTGTFNNIDVTNVSGNPGLRLENNVNLFGVLSLASNVTVDADGAGNNKILTLLSTADSPSRDAAIGILPSGASVSGKVTVQRFMSIEGSNNTRIYRYISSPIQHATVADLQQEIPVTGSFTGTSTCTGCNTAQSMFAYNEAVITDTNGNGVNTADDGYIDFPNSSNTEEMQPGKGYTFFVRGNTLASAKWDVRGDINAGNVTPITFAVSRTSSGVAANDGWNLVGNPFPSTIDWNASGWTKTNIDAAIYTRDNGNAISRYATWNGVVGTNGGSRYITTGQAFWVKSNSGVPALQANENIKAPGIQSTFFREEMPTKVMRISLTQGAVSDEAVIHFRSDASADFDPAADAIKMPNSGFNLSTQITGKDKLAINSLPETTCNAVLQVLVENAGKGNYTLSFADLETFPLSTSLSFADAFTGATVDVRAQATYNFSITGDPLSANVNRFSLVITATPSNSEFSAATAAVCAGTDGFVTLKGINSDNIYTAFVNDEEVILPSTTSDTLQWNVMSEKLRDGDNDLMIRATPLVCGTVNEKHIILNVAAIISPESVTAGSACREGEISLSATGGSDGSIYNWYERESDVVPVYQSDDPDFITPALNKSKHYYVSISNVLGCEGDRVPVLAEVIHYDDAKITLAGDSLVVNHADGITWYLNDVLIPNAQSSAILPDGPGVYRVVVSIGSCTTESVYTIEPPDDGVTGTEKLIESAVYIYPNPVARELFIELSPRIHKVRNVLLRNELGQQIGIFNLVVKNGQFTGSFDMTPLAAGLYTVEITTEEGKAQFKVIKKK